MRIKLANKPILFLTKISTAISEKIKSLSLYVNNFVPIE